MDAKLTLKLDEQIIERAKSYARSKNTSLSNLIESYLALLTHAQKTSEVSPLVKSISGILPADMDPKEDYRNHIAKKYMR